jgi:hypothetical protein
MEQHAMNNPNQGLLDLLKHLEDREEQRKQRALGPPIFRIGKTPIKRVKKPTRRPRS